MQNLVLDCKIMFVTSLIMLVGTEADVIVVEMEFTAPQQFSGHMECSGYPNLTVPGQAFLRQFTNAIVHILTGNIINRYLKSNDYFNRKYSW